jgi:serine/threonine-protein kinase
VVAPALAALVVVGVAAALVLRPGGSEKKAGAPVPPRIVVLPFENLGPPEDAYFAAGMAEEITSRLANVRGLRVISRTTAVGYDRTGKTVTEIGADLGVDYVLEGSVRWEHGQGPAGRVRITPQLIRVSDDTHVWAERYDRVLAGVFAIQSEVAVNAVEAMDIALLPREQTALSEVSTDDLAAYDHYLRGRELLDGGEDRPHIEGAVGMFQAAVDRDPRFARALAGLARAHLFMYWLYYDRSEERLANAKDAAERAVGLRPDLADTHVALGYYFYHGLLDYPRALDELAAARRIQPNNGDAIAGAGYILRRQGRWAEAAAAIGEAVELDPKNAVLLSNLGEASMLAGRYPEAARAFGLARALSPTWATPYGLGAWVEVHWRGDLAAGQAILDQAAAVPGFTDDGSVAWASFLFEVFRRDYSGGLRRLETGNRRPGEAFLDPMPTALMRGQVERLAGLTDAARRSFDAARRELEPMVEKAPKDPRFRVWLALAYAGLGRADDAVREARAACDLLVAAQDAFMAINAFENVAVVLAMVGRYDEAIAALRDLQARSGAWWVHPLRFSPVWDPLRADPRFQALLANSEVEKRTSRPQEGR